MEKRVGFIVAAVFGISVLAGYAAPYPSYVPFMMIATFLIPGIALMLVVNPQIDDVILASLVMGICFHVVYGYILSVFHIGLNTVSLWAPSVLAALILLFQGIKIQHINFKWRNTVLFVPFLVFVAMCFNIIPGENGATHLFYLRSIMEASYIPSSSTLYNIPTGYPMGFHFIVYEMNFFSGNWQPLFLSGAVIASLVFIPCYLGAKKMHSEKAGWFAGIIALFVSFVIIKNVSIDLCCDILSYVLQGFTIYLLLDFLKRSHTKKALLIGVVCAAGIEVHPSFWLVLPAVFIFIVYSAFREEFMYLISFFGVFLLLSFPYLVRVPSFGYSPYEISQLVAWFNQEQFTGEIVPFYIGIWTVILGIFGFLVVEKRHVPLLGCRMSASLVFVMSSVIHIDVPYWYTFCATRLLGNLCVPLSILGALFIARTITSRAGVVLLFFLMLLGPTVTASDITRASPEYYIPTTSEYFQNDQEAMRWLDADSYILNDWWEGTGSAWILPLTGKKVVFPRLNFHDHFTTYLNIPEKEKKSFVVAALPDIEESLQFLEEEGITHIFLSGYVSPEAAWRRRLWDGELITESPNYEVVFHKGGTYLFRVLGTLKVQKVFSLSCITSTYIDNPSTLHLEMGNVSFCPCLYLKITYIDSGYSTFDLSLPGVKEPHLATVPRTNTRASETLYFRLPHGCGEKITVGIHPHTDPLCIEEIAVVTSLYGIKISRTAALIGTSWTQYQNEFIADSSSEDSHMYLFSPKKGVLKITYVDDAEGNVDFNILTWEGSWDRALVLERVGDHKIKEVCIRIPGGYSFIHIGVHVWESDFTICKISYEVDNLVVL